MNIEIKIADTEEVVFAGRPGVKKAAKVLAAEFAKNSKALDILLKEKTGSVLLYRKFATDSEKGANFILESMLDRAAQKIAGIEPDKRPIERIQRELLVDFYADGVKQKNGYKTYMHFDEALCWEMPFAHWAGTMAIWALGNIEEITERNPDAKITAEMVGRFGRKPVEHTHRIVENFKPGALHEEFEDILRIMRDMIGKGEARILKQGIHRGH